jgi:hypothetical protein
LLLQSYVYHCFFFLRHFAFSVLIYFLVLFMSVVIFRGLFTGQKDEGWYDHPLHVRGFPLTGVPVASTSFQAESHLGGTTLPQCSCVQKKLLQDHLKEVTSPTVPRKF